MTATSAYHPRQRGSRARNLILAELARRKASGERTPSMQELAAVSGLTIRGVRYHLDLLEKQGLIRRSPGARGIELIDVVAA